MKTVGVVQARMGSTRLPGKVMMDLGGVPVVNWSLRALTLAPGVDEVVLATSVADVDDQIARWGRLEGWKVVRGSEEDVVSRFMDVLKETGADILLRATGDCPFLDPQVIGEVVALRKHGNYDYCSNVHPPSYPDGLDIECFTRQALEITHVEAANPTDRDTVTQFMFRNRSRFPAGNVRCPIPLQDERWVLDGPEDYEFCKTVVDWMRATDGSAEIFSYLQLKTLLDRYPGIRKINAMYSRNERFLLHMTEEKKKSYSYQRTADCHAKAATYIPLAAQTFSKSYLQYPPDCPLFVSHGDGAYVFDVDGNRYLDLVCGLLPNVLGYRDPDVDNAIRTQLDSGISFSLSTELEYQLAKRLNRLIPCAEQSRFAKNGSDVTAAAVRLARACTGRDRVLLITNGYHGWHDWSIATTERSLGVPLGENRLAPRLSMDLDKIEHEINKHKHKYSRGQVAAVMVEPEGKNVGWLAELRSLCDAYDVLLIFDEVITGFRWALGGYQEYSGVTPDLACFGKAMGNGMPIAALVGKEQYMRRCAPPNNIFFSLTFGGETLSLAAAIATIDKMERCRVIHHIWETGDQIRDQLDAKIRDHGLEDTISIRGDNPRLHVDMPDELRGLWVKSMIDSGTLIINCNNMSWPLRQNEIHHLMASYDASFERITSWLKQPKDTRSAIPTGGVSLVR